MRKLLSVLVIFSAFIYNGYSQAEIFNLEAKNLHKKVRKTIEHFYKYDQESGGFVKTSVNINRFNDAGNLVETYSLYNSKYAENSAKKKLYNYNADGLLISTKDISDKKSKFSTEYKLIYDKKDNLIKTESVYKDGSKFYTVFKNDKKGKLINKKEYNKENVLTADINYTYKGDKKNVNRTSFNNKDGSIIGNYITNYEDEVQVLYKSESKYGNTSTTYKYNKEGDLTSSTSTGKSNSKTTYDYEYDKKDNWIKKHYRSGKYQYFYFREIYFENGVVTGSTNFDKQFINRLGNFANVAVVPLKMKEKPLVDKSISNINSSSLKDKTWVFDYVYVGKVVKKLNGTVALNTLYDNNLKLNSDATFTVKFSASTFNFNLKVNSFTTLDDKYEYKLSNTNGESGLLWVYKKTKPLRDDALDANFNVNGLFLMKEKDGSSMSFYLK